MYVLAGDVGGTSTRLAIYTRQGDRLRRCREHHFASREFASFYEPLKAFLAEGKEKLAAAAIGVAGPILSGVVEVTNLPWRIDTADLGARLDAPVRLLNDLEALGYGSLYLQPDELHCLNRGIERAGHRALIAAGTGLGQGLLFWDGAKHHPIATEGGHADFAGRNPTELLFAEFLIGEYGRAEWEGALSGPGLHNVFRFVTKKLGVPAGDEVEQRIAAGEDPGSVIGAAALEGSSPACERAVDIFVEIYGAQAGNIALSAMTLGGVYVGGGIAAKLLPKLQAGSFLEAFCSKEPFGSLMREIPVYVITGGEPGLDGAAQVAASLAEVPAQ